MRPLIRPISRHNVTSGVLVAVLACAATAAPSPAIADPAKAEQYFNEAEKLYSLRKFDQAVQKYLQAYEEEDAPQLLFNIAQSYRQLGNCKDSLFYYKRFLQLGGSQIAGSLRKEVEGRIIELERCIKDQIASGPPDGTSRPPGTKPGKPGTITKPGTTTTPGTTKPGTTTTPGTTKPGTTTNPGTTKPGTTTTPGTTTNPGTTRPGTTTTTKPSKPGKPIRTARGDDEPDDPEEPGTEIPEYFEPVQPTLISARANLGISKVLMPGGKNKVPVQFSLAITGGYPLAITEQITVDAGVGFTLTPVPYRKEGLAMGSGTAFLTALMANGSGTYAVNDRISARGELGLGVLWFSGLEAGNLFTEGGRPNKDGPLAMFHLRFAVAGEYAITPNIVATVTPAFTFSPAHEGLVDGLSQISSFDFLAGVGYRM